ncbi:ATP-binding protein [Saccharibacillus sp. VR-M41]|uniref:ATP-binding protein n=1 Tax=Saccharibacillus alkalitolerans TaxID=2705290 RepID=A0ABX0FC50_9BACL|nr:ATP-binding protein [Saccharibacillus alkalitolerans]
MNQTKIPKRISSALVNSLSAGVVPRIGLEYIAVGRKLEIESVLRELGNVAEGGAAFKLITGRYGSGKSFLIQILRNYAMDRDFVVADADLSPERRLVGTKGQGLATYRELMTHLSTRTRPDGGALEAVLQKWFASLQQQAMAELGLRPDDEKLQVEVERRIFEVTGNMEHMVHGFDFARVLSAYWNGYKMSDDELKQNALRWLRGEFPTKTEARKALGVGVIIDDDNWYDYMKLWAEFTARIGYKGLLLFIDEGVNLYKITNTVSRQSNYEKLLTIFNDTMQGKAQHLGIFLGGTPQFVEDQRRGLFSYDALRSRLVAGRFGEGAGMLHYAGPILRLEMLSHAEILVLLEKLRDLHASHYGYAAALDQRQLMRFMESELGRMGADALLTTREVVRDFMDLLNTMHQYSERGFDQLLPEAMNRLQQSGGLFDNLGGGSAAGEGSASGAGTAARVGAGNPADGAPGGYGEAGESGGYGEADMSGVRDEGAQSYGAGRGYGGYGAGAASPETGGGAAAGRPQPAAAPSAPPKPRGSGFGESGEELSAAAAGSASRSGTGTSRPDYSGRGDLFAGGYGAGEVPGDAPERERPRLNASAKEADAASGQGGPLRPRGSGFQSGENVETLRSGEVRSGAVSLSERDGDGRERYASDDSSLPPRPTRPDDEGPDDILAELDL